VAAFGTSGQATREARRRRLEPTVANVVNFLASRSTNVLNNATG